MATTYKKNDLVHYSPHVYVYINDTPSAGNLPTDNNFWSIWAQGVASTGAGDMLSTNNLNDIDDPALARENLGLEIGVDVQPFDANYNTFSTGEKNKLAAIEAGATADMTDTEITDAYNGVVPAVSATEITAGTETEIRRFSPANVVSLINEHSSGGGGADNSSDLFALQLRLADLEGDALGVNDGIADPFDDETDVDTTASSNQFYNSDDDYYMPSQGLNVMPQMTSPTTSGVTVTEDSVSNSRHGWEVFDRISASSNSSAIWHSDSNGGNGWLKIDFGSPLTIASYSLTSGKGTHSTHAPLSWILQGSDDDTNWVDLDTQNVSNWGEEEKRSFIMGDAQTYRYFRFDINSTQSNTNIVLSEGELLAPPDAMSLISNGFSAINSPSSARLLFFARPIDTINLNTNLNGFVSRDGGTTWTQATLLEVQTYSNGQKVFEAVDIDLNSQPVGTTVKYRIDAVSKNVEVHGAILQWS